MRTLTVAPYLAAFALTTLCNPGAQAMDSWLFNPTGGGVQGAVEISSLDAGGYGFIENAFTWNPFVSVLPYLSFSEHGAYKVAGLGDQFEMTLTYEIGGRLGVDGGHIDDGLISLYLDDTPDFGTTVGIFGADDGLRLAQFEVVAGSVGIFPLSASAMATLVPGTLLPGFFFNTLGQDLTTVSGLTASVAVSSQVIDPTGTNVVSEIACEYAGYTGDGCNGQAYSPAFLDIAHATVQDVATASLSYNEGLSQIAVVPEPGAATMWLAGLLGIGAWRRMRS